MAQCSDPSWRDRYRDVYLALTFAVLNSRWTSAEANMHRHANLCRRFDLRHAVVTPGQAGGLYYLLGNPLNAGLNTVQEVLPGVPNGTTVYVWDGFGFRVNTYTTLFGWEHPSHLVSPGRGFFLYAPQDFTLMFVGEVPQGQLVTPLGSGWNLVSSQVPLGGYLISGLHSGLQYPAIDTDIVFRWNVTAQEYLAYERGECPGDS